MANEKSPLEIILLRSWNRFLGEERGFAQTIIFDPTDSKNFYFKKVKTSIVIWGMK